MTAETYAPEQPMALVASGLLDLPVEHEGARLGRVSDVLCGPLLDRLVGFEVIGSGDVRRFVPHAVCRVSAPAIELTVRLALFHEAELAYYRRHGSSFVRLRGAPVLCGALTLGRLVDLRFAGGTRCSLVVRDADGVDVEVETGLASAASPAGVAVATERPRLLAPRLLAQV